MYFIPINFIFQIRNKIPSCQVDDDDALPLSHILYARYTTTNDEEQVVQLSADTIVDFAPHLDNARDFVDLFMKVCIKDNINDHYVQKTPKI